MTDEDRLARARRYERQLSASDRRARGYFATPPAIADALARWAVRDPDARVLDPAVGGGVFALAAVRRLRDLTERDAAGVGDREPEDVPGSVLAVDVDAGALAVARRVLGEDPAVETREADFFDLDPADVGRFDAVVGNPPFVRQEDLEKDHVRAHLAAFGPDGETPYLAGERAIDRRSDAYVYFLTQATRFLRAGGRLGMVVPTKWLATRYGEPLQRFLYDHHRVHAVVGFSARAFDDALVDAALVCLQRRGAARDGPGGEAAGGAGGGDGAADGPVRFVRVTDETSPSALAAAVERPPEADGRTVHEGDAHATVAVPQSDLAARGPGKLGHYLAAPPAVPGLLDDEALVTLGDLATVSYGHKTGANDFFFLDADDPVADRFRLPAVTSFREVDGVVLGADDVPAEVLDVHDYVQAVDTVSADDPAEAVLDAMAADGYADTVEYVRAGEHAGYADRTTCAARRVWFDLGALAAPAVLHPKFFDERVRVVHNRAGAVPSNAIDCLDVADGVPVEPLLGALNCSLYRLALECWGRSEGGGALQVMTYELQQVPVADVRAFGPADRERVAAAFGDLAASEAGDATTDAQRRLDAAVVDAAGVDADPDRVADLRRELVRRRVDGADAGVQVDGTER